MPATPLRLVVLALATACAPAPDGDDSAAEGPSPAVRWVPAAALNTTTTWEYTQQDDGAFVCALRRQMVALEHPLARATVCPDCDHAFAGLNTIPDEDADCVAQLVPSTPSVREEFYLLDRKSMWRVHTPQPPPREPYPVTGPTRCAKNWSRA